MIGHPRAMLENSGSQVDCTTQTSGTFLLDPKIDEARPRSA